MTRDDPAAFAPPPAFGPFRVLHQIGIGALGPVFRTYEPTRDRLVAVKVFRLDVTPEHAQSLADELGRAADAGLFHPSVVEPIAAGVEGTVAYRAEEYVAAESLDVAIRHYAPASLDKALPFLTQLAGAIDFARAAGVGHGALHLRDIFVTPDEARASGFGVVEALERVGIRAPVRRPYTAPERIAGESWSTPADVFSLGAIAYELLTGRRPSGTGDQIGPLTVKGTDNDEHPALRAVLARAMDDDPARRYPTALAFASALEDASRQPTGFAPILSPVVAAPLAEGGQPPSRELELRDEREEEREDDAIDEPLHAAPADPGIDEPGDDDPAGDPASPDGEPEATHDSAAERDEDMAHYALLRDDAVDEPGPTLFDDEAAADFVEASGGFSGAGVHELPAFRPAQEIVSPAPQEEEVRPVNILERARPAMLPLAVTLILGLLVGFAAGYVVAGRQAENARRAAVAAAASAAAASTAQPPAGRPQELGRAYSEQTVQPPVAPPPVPGDVPPGSRARESTAAAPRASTGRISVTSTPAGAGVTVDGKWRGRTPLTLDALRFGRYNVRIVRPGFAVVSQEVAVSAADPSRTLAVRLQPGASAPPAPSRTETASRDDSSRLVGAIYVDSRPRGARVLIDGRPSGTTPVRVPGIAIGSHVVRLELPDHKAWTVSARVSAGKQTPVTGSLERIR